MQTLLTVIHLLTAVVLVLTVLLQSSKGSDVAGAFGGMGAQTAFGPRGTATFLSKSTVVLAVIFVITSVTLVRLGSEQVGGGESVLSDEPVAEAPATPAAPATPVAPAAAPVTVSGTATSTTPAATPQIQDVTPNPAVPTGVRITTPAPATPAPAAAPAPANQ